MNTHEPLEGADQGALNETALRILNLLFILNSSSVPLSTEQIVSDVDLGYGSGNRASDLKKFRRDREKLAERGIAVKEIKPTGGRASEESLWTIDRASSFAAVGAITRDDADALMRAVDECLSRSDIPFRQALLDIKHRLDAMSSPTARGAQAAVDDGWHEPSRAEDAMWTAFSLKRKIRFVYRDAKGAESQRTLEIWGIFMQEGHSYYVGLDEQTGSVRTFRSDRIVRAWRPAGHYTVPGWFDVRDYLFLPFDLGGGMSELATFTFPRDMGAAELRALTKGRGSVVRTDTEIRWSIKVRNMREAARFCLAHAHRGMRPFAPGKLVHAWKDLMEKAVEAHGCAFGR